MKSLFAFIVMTALPLSLQAAERGQVAGEYIELHACEVYTGGCTASAQITQGGRSLLRVWNFSQGPVDFTNRMSILVLETAEGNLALPQTESKKAVAYLPDESTASQREALLGWLKDNGVHVTESRAVPISYRRDGSHIMLKAGDSIALSTRAIESCDAGSCGEQLWYTPRGKTGTFTVLVNDQSSVEEPLLALSWKDNGAKSVFFGKFGTSEPPEFTLASIP